MVTYYHIKQSFWHFKHVTTCPVLTFMKSTLLKGRIYKMILILTAIESKHICVISHLTQNLISTSVTATSCDNLPCSPLDRLFALILHNAANFISYYIVFEWVKWFKKRSKFRNSCIITALDCYILDTFVPQHDKLDLKACSGLNMT